MPTVTKKADPDRCPVCGERLTEVSLLFEPFPGEDSISDRIQVTKGCQNCGWQKHLCSEYLHGDPYNQNRRDPDPTNLEKDIFKL